MFLVSGTSLAHYHIVAPLGAGGMGEVYRATDTKLGRAVALKLIAPELAKQTDRLERFRREAKALAALDHPNIVTVFSVEETEGVHFLTMQLVEGQSLDSVIPDGGLPLDRILQIAEAVAEALAAAHDKSIVHRDLKPANVMISADGRVKVLDFGLAKDVTASGPDDATLTSGGHTEHGVLLGTPAYMSPEQIAGRTVDHRTDIFSLGILLYQMASGQRPFAGTSSFELASSILRDAPPAVTSVRTGLPADFAGLVRRCLEKDPRDRIQTARQVGQECRELVRQASHTKPAVMPSIAVLPFVNMSADKEHEYFSDGLTEEIINALVKVPGLKVIARTSAFAFKHQNTDIRKIAEVLGVTNILEGSVRRAGNRIRVTAQLIVAADGTHLWSERYDREVEDLFAIQDDIAAAIAAELRLKFSPDASARPRRQPNLQAYEAYLRYLHYQWGFTQESLRLSRECLEQAIALDPEFALPYAGLADHHLASTVAGAPAVEAMPRARELARRALEADPDLPEAHGILGIVAGNYDHDWREAERRFGLATARLPIPWHVRQWHSYFYLLSVGRTEESVREAERTLEDDPLSQVNHMVLGFVMDALGRREDAQAAYVRMLDLDPRFWWGWWALGMHHAMHRSHADARTCAEKALAMFPSGAGNIGLMAGVHLQAGEPSRAEALLAQAPPDDYGAPYARTCFHLVCGDFDAALEWAGKVADQRNPIFFQSTIRPFQNVLRKSSAWPALLRKMNLTEPA